MTFEEIGKVLGISEERTRRIYHKAIAKLSHPRNKDKWRKSLRNTRRNSNRENKE